MSKFKGDSAMLLSSLPKAEVSPKVQSYKVSTNLQMKKQINIQFKDYEFKMEKIRRAQQKHFLDLKRVHQDRRRMLRENHKFKQEDLRLQIERGKRDEYIRTVLDEYNVKSQEILEDLLKSQKKKRQSLKPLPETGLETGVSNNAIEGVAAENEKTDNVIAGVATKSENTDTNENTSDKPVSAGECEEISDSRRSSASLTLETVSNISGIPIENIVNYDNKGTDVLTDNETGKQGDSVSHESKNDDRDENTKSEELNLVRERSKVLEVNLKDKDNPKTKIVEKTTELPPLKVTPRVLIEPPPKSYLLDQEKEMKEQKTTKKNIKKKKGYETDLEDISEDMSSSTSPQHSKEIISVLEANTVHHKDVSNANRIHHNDVDDAKDDTGENLPSRSLSPSHNSTSTEQVSNVELLRRSRKERELRIKNMVKNSSFDCYSKTKEGQLMPMYSKPNQFPTEIPSNKYTYMRDKYLKELYRSEMDRELKINGFYDKVQNDIEQYGKATEKPRLRQKKEPKEIKTKLADGAPIKFTQSIFVRIQQKFLEEPLPEGMDPNSREALERCKYIRKYSKIESVPPDILEVFKKQYEKELEP